MNVGEKIRLTRLEKKMSQEEIADALNITQRAYSKIENNEVQVKIDRLQEIANILQVETTELLTPIPTQNINGVTYSQVGNGRVINNISVKEIHLLEKIIETQKQEIEYLKGLIDIFKK